MNTSPPPTLATLIETLNSNQTEALDFDGHCVVLAGPGSGKTRVLVAKVARSLTQGTKGPRGVACITYNNEAVREVRNRLGDIGFSSDRRLFIGTVHSFCLECVVTPFGRLFRKDLLTEFSVAGTSQQDLALQEAMNEIGLMGRPADYRDQLSKYRRTHLERDTDQWFENAQLAKLIETYESRLRQDRMLDFDDLVLVALNLIRRHEFVRSALEARFPFLVVDEYQDLGYPLHMIVRSLMRLTQMDVFAVGDPDQSIYGFAGASPKYLRSLAQDSAVHKVTLDLNYRSIQQIIDKSQVVLDPVEPRNYVSARQSSNGGLFIKKCPGGLCQQAEFIATRLIPHLEKQGISHDQIAILFLDKWDAKELRKALDESGIKYAGVRDQRYQRTPFTRWLENVASWCSLYPDSQLGPEFDELFYRYAVLSAEAGILLNIGDLSTRTRFFKTLNSLADPNMPFVEWLNRLDSSLDLAWCLNARRTHPDDLAGWESIVEGCREGEPLAGLDLDRFAGCGGRPDTVVLTSLHSSKGLEFKVVIVPGLEEGRLPSYRARTAEEFDEARRLFYVGMTRAKDAICLLYSGWYRGGHNTTWRKGPSRYVIELQSNEQQLPSP